MHTLQVPAYERAHDVWARANRVMPSPAYRTSQEATLSSTIHPDARQIYHSLRPHPALDPAGDGDELSQREQQRHDSEYRRMISQGLLAVLLPNEDLQNPCLFALVSEILADLILGSIIGGRLCEAEFLYGCIRNACEVAQTRTCLTGWITSPFDEPEQNRLKRYGLLVEQDAFSQSNHTHWWRSTNVHWWNVLHYILMACMAIRSVITILFSTPPAPPIKTETSGTPVLWPANLPALNSDGVRIGQEKAKQPNSLSISNPAKKTALISVSLWPALGNLLSLRKRMPWVVGLCSLVRHLGLTGPGKVGRTNSHLDR